jgi:hypothetical protein
MALRSPVYGGGPEGFAGGAGKRRRFPGYYYQRQTWS